MNTRPLVLCLLLAIGVAGVGCSFAKPKPKKPKTEVCKNPACTTCQGKGKSTCGVCRGVQSGPPCQPCAGRGFLAEPCTKCHGVGTLCGNGCSSSPAHRTPGPPGEANHYCSCNNACAPRCVACGHKGVFSNRPCTDCEPLTCSGCRGTGQASDGSRCPRCAPTVDPARGTGKTTLCYCTSTPHPDLPVCSPCADAARRPCTYCKETGDLPCHACYTTGYANPCGTCFGRGVVAHIVEVEPPPPPPRAKSDSKKKSSSSRRSIFKRWDD